jgi:nicotinamide mononucleotide transporter
MEEVLSMVSSSYFEYFAVFMGAIGVFFNAKGNRLGWIFGFFSVFPYFFIFAYHHLFGSAFLNFYYTVSCFAGWLSWQSNSDAKPHNITLLSKQQLIWVLVMTLFLWATIYALLKITTSFTLLLPNFALGDALITALSLVAQWLLVKKKIENWYLWLMVNFVSVLIYAFAGLYLTAFLYSIYFVIAIYGILEWQREIKNSYQEK